MSMEREMTRTVETGVGKVTYVETGFGPKDTLLTIEFRGVTRGGVESVLRALRAETLGGETWMDPQVAALEEILRDLP